MQKKTAECPTAPSFAGELKYRRVAEYKSKNGILVNASIELIGAQFAWHEIPDQFDLDLCSRGVRPLTAALCTFV